MNNHSTSNRSRRIPNRIKSLLGQIATYQNLVRENENQAERCDKDSAALFAGRARAFTGKIGPLMAQVRILEERLSELPATTVIRRNGVSSFFNPVFRLPRTDSFPAADCGRRVGKCAQAFRSVASMWSTLGAHAR